LLNQPVVSCKRGLKDRTKLDVDDAMELLEFICNTTYFIFDGTVMQQKFGTAMSSPVSAAVANFYMEKLEQKALRTAPVNCKTKLWKRYDILEAIKKDQIAEFTDHLNALDETGRIKFTYELKRTPIAQSPSWTYSSGANPMGLSPQRYTGNPCIPTNIYISGHTIPLTI